MHDDFQELKTTTNVMFPPFFKNLHGFQRQAVVGETQVRQGRLVSDEALQNRRDGLIAGLVSVQLQRAQPAI